MFPLLVMAAAEIDVGKMSEVAENNKKTTVQWILLPPLLLPLSRPADVGLASRAVIPSGHYHKTPHIKEEICMTLAGAQDRPSRAGWMVGKMMGAMKAARASEPHPETHSRILVAGTCLSFSILGETSERSCPEEADGGDLAAGQHPKPPFSLLSHLPILCGGGGGGGVAVEEEDEDDGGGRQRSTEEEWWQ